MAMMIQDLVELTLWSLCKFDIEAVEIVRPSLFFSMPPGSKGRKSHLHLNWSS
jgi:hypothetical protein